MCLVLALGLLGKGTHLGPLSIPSWLYSVAPMQYLVAVSDSPHAPVCRIILIVIISSVGSYPSNTNRLVSEDKGLDL